MLKVLHMPPFLQVCRGTSRSVFYSVIRGFHVYKAIWTPTIGEELSTDREHGNPADQYAVAVQKSGTTANYKRHILKF